MKVRKGIELGNSLVRLGGEAKGQRLNIGANRYNLVLPSRLIKVILRAEGERLKKFLDVYDLIFDDSHKKPNPEDLFYNSE